MGHMQVSSYSRAVIERTKGSTTECKGTIGIGGTVIRTAINKSRLESKVSQAC